MGVVTASAGRALAVTLLGATTVIVGPAAAAGAAPGEQGPSYPSGVTVRGSIEQFYVLNADPGDEVRLDGQVEGEVNESGGWLSRDDVTAGPHTVEVGSASYSVTVGSSETPQADVLAAANAAGRHRAMATDANGLPLDDGFIEVSDGTLLDYRVGYPQGSPPGSVFDVVVIYSGYRPGLDPGDEDLFTKLIAEGYAVVGVNMRGTGCSGGSVDMMEELVGRDGYDVIETLAEQDWVDDIAMAGASWPGLSQLFVAQHQPPHLDAIAPGAVLTDLYRDVAYPGGVPASNFLEWWELYRAELQLELPIVDDDTGELTPCGRNQALRDYDRSVVGDFFLPENATYNDYWRTRTVDIGAIEAPTLLVNSWHDEQTGSRAAVVFDQFDANTPARMIAVPAMHGAYNLPSVWDEVTTFLDVYLTGDPGSVAAYESRSPIEVRFDADHIVLLDEFDQTYDPSVHDFVLGTELFAERAGTAQSSFRYELGSGAFWGTVNHDGTSFTSAPLDDEVVMAGSGSIDLSILPESEDVDLEASLIEVRADGTEQLVQSGWLRASHGAEVAGHPLGTAFRPFNAHTAETSAPLVPGQWTDVRVELLPFGYVFQAGSRIKLVVDAPGGAGQFWWGVTGQARPDTHVTIGHGGDHVSKAVLPVIETPVLVDGAGNPTASRPGPVACVLPPWEGETGEEQLASAILAAWWHPCRLVPSIESLGYQVTDGNLVTLTSESTPVPWNVAGIFGPQLTASGSVVDRNLAYATGANSFRAPPGTHRYTLALSNEGGVEAYETITVDVPGFEQDVVTLTQPPTQPYEVTWADVGDTYWVSLDGQGLHGMAPLTEPQVAIPANLLTSGTHTLRLVTCTTSCDSELTAVSPIDGTVTYHTAVGSSVTGIENNSSLIATVTSATGETHRIYASDPGLVWSLSVPDGSTVSAGAELAKVLLDGSTQESMQIVVG